MPARFLEGIRITDLTWAGAGPFCTKIFADQGADVMKVESLARPDPVRRSGPFKDGVAGLERSGNFAARNTGKKSVALNLKEPEARALVLRLVAQSDVVASNFGAGVMERLEMDYQALRKIKPDIICLSMPMYGPHGPRAKMLGVGKTISAVTGLMWQTAYGPGDVLGPGTHYPDHAANPYHAAFALLAALRHRRRTGKGMEIDLAQVESTANFSGAFIVEAGMTGRDPAQVGNRSRIHAPHNVFRAAGADQWVAVTVLDDGQWSALCRAIGRADLAADARLARAADRIARLHEVEGAVQQWVETREPADVVRQLRAAGVPVSKVQNARDLVDHDAQLAANGYFQRIDHPETGPMVLNSPPFRMDGERIAMTRPPLLGEHTDEVLSSVLKLSAADLSALRNSKAIS